MLEGYKVAIAVMDFNFIAATMGSVVGEKLTRCIERATHLLDVRAVVEARCVEVTGDNRGEEFGLRDRMPFALRGYKFISLKNRVDGPAVYFDASALHGKTWSVPDFGVRRP